MAVSRARYGGWRKWEIARWVNRRALDAVGGVLAISDECPMVCLNFGCEQRRKLENGAVSKLFEFGHCRRRALKKCLCSGDCQMADCQSIVRSACTAVGFWKATGVQCRSGNRLPEALQGRFTIFRRTGYFQRRFSCDSRRDKSLAITPSVHPARNVDYAANYPQSSPPHRRREHKRKGPAGKAGPSCGR